MSTYMCNNNTRMYEHAWGIYIHAQVLEWLLEEIAKRPPGAPGCVMRYVPHQSAVLLVEEDTHAGHDADVVGDGEQPSKRARTA